MNKTYYKLIEDRLKKQTEFAKELYEESNTISRISSQLELLEIQLENTRKILDRNDKIIKTVEKFSYFIFGLLLFLSISMLFSV